MTTDAVRTGSSKTRGAALLSLTSSWLLFVDALVLLGCWVRVCVRMNESCDVHDEKSVVVKREMQSAMQKHKDQRR